MQNPKTDRLLRAGIVLLSVVLVFFIYSGIHERVVLRGDSAFFDAALLDFCADNGAEFAIVAPTMANLVAMADAIKPADWKPFRPKNELATEREPRRTRREDQELESRFEGPRSPAGRQARSHSVAAGRHEKGERHGRTCLSARAGSATRFLWEVHRDAPRP